MAFLHKHLFDIPKLFYFGIWRALKREKGILACEIWGCSLQIKRTWFWIVLCTRPLHYTKNAFKDKKENEEVTRLYHQKWGTSVVLVKNLH